MPESVLAVPAALSGTAFDTIAAVDLGSNSFHLMVARVSGDQLQVIAAKTCGDKRVQREGRPLHWDPSTLHRHGEGRIDQKCHACLGAGFGFLDFDVIDRIVRERAIELLDHYALNDLIDNPTAENVLLWVWQRLREHVRGLEELVLWETPSACAILRKTDAVAGDVSSQA